MKIFLRIYIAVITCMTLAMPAAERVIAPGITIRTHGIFAGGYRSNLDHVDLLTTAVSLLAAIAPAAFLLLYWDKIAAFIGAHRRTLMKIAGVSAAAISAIIAILVIGSAISNIETTKEKSAIIVAPMQSKTPDPNLILVPTYPATANQVRRATKSNP